MKTSKFTLLSLFITLVFTSCNTYNSTTIPQKEEVGKTAFKDEISTIKAPFETATFTKPTFPSFSLNINNEGAKENTLCTTIIQNCIDKASQQGGGTVIIPKGEWISGRIILKDNTNLHFEDGAELHFSGEIKDYQPAVFTRIEGIEVMSLGACIYANNAKNIAITGHGKLFGPKEGPVREYIYRQDVIENVVALDKLVEDRKYSGTNGEGYFLPMFISPINCKKVYIEGISLQNTAFWNIVPTYCDNVIIRGVDVHSVGIERGDGIDIESSKNVLIEYCTLSCGDDCFTLKAGRGEDGVKIGRATENVIIRYCLAKEGHGGITCGSETAGNIKNLYVHDCVLDNTGVGIRFKTRRPRGGGGSNLHYERIRMKLRYTAFKWDMLGSVGSVGELANRLPQREINALTPEFKDIFMNNIIIEECSNFMRVLGIPESPLKNLHMNNVNANCNKLITINDADGIEINNTNIKCSSDTLLLCNAKNININNCNVSTTRNQITVLTDSISQNEIKFNNSNPSKITSHLQ